MSIRNHKYKLRDWTKQSGGVAIGQSQSTTEERLDQRDRVFLSGRTIQQYIVPILVYRIKRVYDTPDTTIHNDDNDVDNTLDRYRSKETHILITQIKPIDHRVYLYIALFICLIK